MNVKKLLSLLLALVMVLGLAACGSPAADDGAGSAAADNAPAETADTEETAEAPNAAGEPVDLSNGYAFYIVAPIAAEELGSGTVKWTEERTGDGWVRIVNDGGETLGYSKNSGVEIIQVDGYAFKDLDRDGELDGYEDWRLDDTTRAVDLASQISIDEIYPLIAHGTWASFGSSIEGADLEFVEAGGRSAISRSASAEGSSSMAVTWNNALQALCEGTGNWGIPAIVSADPGAIGGISSLALASTMDPELARAIGADASRQYRTVGVTMLLAPQVDLVTTPQFDRGSGTFGEDPALTRDIAAAYVDGLQSTYDEDGNDIGWGGDSMTAVVKHYAGAGAAEGGRNDHGATGKYTVFPGNNFAAHIVAYFDGVLDLDGKTESAYGIMPNYAVAYSRDGSLGELVGGAFSAYKMGLLRNNGFDGIVVTDWEIVKDAESNRPWGMEDYTEVERIAVVIANGGDQIGGYSDVDILADVYDALIDMIGKADAENRFREAAYHIFKHSFQTGLFDNAYLDTDVTLATAFSADAKAFAASTQEQAVIMLKNSDNVIQPADGEMKTVYIPYVFSSGNTGSSSASGEPGWDPALDIELAGKYFNVVTDTLLDPSGVDADGNAVYTESDIARASADELAAVDYAIVSMTAPYTGSSVDDEGNYLPASLQYEAYTADTARVESIAGDVTVETIPDSYTGSTTRETKENRSYAGNSVGRASNYADLELLQYVSSAVPDSAKVIVSMSASHPMVWSEVEPLADVILLSYANTPENILRAIAGELEPSALLPLQQPANMETVEAQKEDVPRDMECYVDADGNAYDFAFGMNWSGVIDDERVATYSADPVTTPVNIDFEYAN